MPQFAHPLLLLFAAAVPFVTWIWWRRPRPALRFPNVKFFAGLRAGQTRRIRWGGAGIRALALLLIVLAMSGPRWPDRRTRLPTQGIAISMVVDVSGSMAEPDFIWQGQRVTRLEAVKRAFDLFVAGGDGPESVHLDGRPDDAVGIVAFSTRPISLCPLTLSHQVVTQMLDGEQPRSLPTESQTNIGDAIAWGLHQLASSGDRRKVMILLSDGEHNVPPPALKPRQAAQLAANLQVPIYAIDAGGLPEKNGPEPGAGDAQAQRAQGIKTLQAVARITQGQYFRAQVAKGLLSACQEIDQLERKEIQSFLYRRYYEGYAWFGLSALALLALIGGLEMTLWQRIP